MIQDLTLCTDVEPGHHRHRLNPTRRLGRGIRGLTCGGFLPTALQYLLLQPSWPSAHGPRQKRLQGKHMLMPCLKEPAVCHGCVAPLPDCGSSTWCNART